MSEQSTKCSVAIAHLKPGDRVLSGSLDALIPPGDVADVRMTRNLGFLYDTTLRPFERSTSHLFTVIYADGIESQAVNGSRRVMVERPHELSRREEVA